MHKEQLELQFIDWFNPNAAAITMVFNKDRILKSTAQTYVRTFAHRIDEARLGGRFYQKPPRDRLHLQAAPELWAEGHPHYHGIVRLPADDLDRLGFDGLAENYASVFGGLVPGGLLQIKPMSDPLGWVRYCSKEHDLICGEDVVWTHSMIPVRVIH